MKGFHEVESIQFMECFRRAKEPRSRDVLPECGERTGDTAYGMDEITDVGVTGVQAEMLFRILEGTRCVSLCSGDPHQAGEDVAPQDITRARFIPAGEVIAMGIIEPRFSCLEAPARKLGISEADHCVLDEVLHPAGHSGSAHERDRCLESLS